MSPRLLLPVLALALLWPSRARAHEGHVHSDEPAVAPVVVAVDTYLAESGAHELLLRTGTLEPRRRASIHLLLADWATNAPVDAGLEVASGDSTWTAREEARGVYVADVVFAEEGYHRLDVVVRHGEEVDLLSIDSVRVGIAPAGATSAATAAPGRGLPGWAFAVFAGFGVLAIAALYAIGRARGARRRALGIVLALVLAGAGGAGAHEGEVHGEDDAPPAKDPHGLHGVTAAALPPGARFMAKEAQFDLGLATVVARIDSLADTRRAFGTVVADPAAAADVVAPQTGRFTGRRAWRIGDRVSRGQALGAVLVVDELPVRAPIGGTIAAVSAVPGQTVTAGQVIARVVDLSRARVEVLLHGEALAAATRARSAVVRLPALPGRAFPARVEGLAPASTGGPAVPLVLAVDGAGDLLRAGMVVEAELRLPGAAPAIVVPSAAVLSTERGPAVFVKIGPEAFVLRPVVPGAVAGGRTAIKSGVLPGERVVTAAMGTLLSTPEGAR